MVEHPRPHSEFEVSLSYTRPVTEQSKLWLLVGTLNMYYINFSFYQKGEDFELPFEQPVLYSKNSVISKASRVPLNQSRALGSLAKYNPIPLPTIQPCEFIS